MEMKLNVKDAKKAGMEGAKELAGMRPMQMLRDCGIRSEHAYLAGFAALGGALIMRLITRRSHEHGHGLTHFLGKSVPLFFLLGLGLKHEE